MTGFRGLRGGGSATRAGIKEGSLTMATYDVKKNKYEHAVLLGNGDVMNIWGTADTIGVSSGGLAHVYDGGSAAHFMLYDKGNLKIWSGGYATSTTVFGSGAAFTVHSATVVDTVVGNRNLGAIPQPNYKARMGISSGAFVSRTTVCNGGTVITHDLVKLVDVAVSNGGTISGNGGQMSNVIVNSGGKVDIAGKNTTDGLLKTLLVYSGASVTVYNRGIIDDVLICPGAVVNIKSGGTGRVIDRSSRLDSGVIGTLNVFDGGQVWSCIVTHSGVLNVSGGAVSNAHVSGTYLSSPVMNVYSYGYATGTIVDSTARMYVYSGGSADSTTVQQGGSMIISSGAVVSGVLLKSFETGKIELRSGASVTQVSLEGEHASLTVGRGAYAEDVGVIGGDSAVAYVSGGGLISGVSVGYGRLVVCRGGIAKDAYAGGELSYLIVSSGGTLSNATVETLAILEVSGGAVADSLIAKSYASANIRSGGKLTGDISISRDYAKVTVDESAIVDVDISKSAPGAEARIKGISLISGTPTLTITVSTTQEKGIYKIADGAASTFSKTFTVNTDAGTTLGTVSVGGTLRADGHTYSLGLASNTLNLTVDGAVVEAIETVAGKFIGAGGVFQLLSDGSGVVRATEAVTTLAGSIDPAKWEIAAVGDFNGDGKDGLLWVEKSTGYAYMQYDMTSFDEVNDKTNCLGVVGEGYSIKAGGDFSGSGIDGVLMQGPAFGDPEISLNYGLPVWARDNTGATYNGWLGALVNTWQPGDPLKGDLNDPASINANNYKYDVIGVGDFNGDGRDDVMLQNTMPKTVNGKTITGSGDVFTFLTGDEAAIKAGAPPTVCYAGCATDGWEVIGFGDFDNDGIDDALLSDGTGIAGWKMAYGQRGGDFWFGNLPSGYGISGVSDVDNDGTDDIILSDAGGGFSAWKVVNGGVTGAIALR